MYETWLLQSVVWRRWLEQRWFLLASTTISLQRLAAYRPGLVRPYHQAGHCTVATLSNYAMQDRAYPFGTTTGRPTRPGAERRRTYAGHTDIVRALPRALSWEVSRCFVDTRRSRRQRWRRGAGRSVHECGAWG